MEFTRLGNIDISKITLVPREDLFVDGSFIAFDIVGEGDINPQKFLTNDFLRFTILKFFNGIVRMDVQRRPNPKGRHYHYIDLTGICTQEESEHLNKLYCNMTGAPPDLIADGEVGGDWYKEIFSRCHPFASSTRRA